MRMKIGLALSGGGSRGFVHTGVLQALEEAQIKADVISGTSAGSIVGSLYAAEYPAHEIFDILNEGSWYHFLSFSISIRGLIKHNYLHNKVQQYLPHDSFNELKKELYIAATNLNTGKVKYFSKGSLADIIVASSSIPLVFEPKKIEDSYYVDGGLVCNFPVKPLVDKCDFIIGVNLVPQVQINQNRMKTVKGVAARVYDLSVLNNIIPHRELCDILIEPEDIQSFSRFKFKGFEAMRDIGYAETKKMIPMIKERIAEKQQESTINPV